MGGDASRPRSRRGAAEPNHDGPRQLTVLSDGDDDQGAVD
jgi:hypothetical protein